MFSFYVNNYPISMVKTHLHAPVLTRLNAKSRMVKPQSVQRSFWIVQLGLGFKFKQKDCR